MITAPLSLHYLDNTSERATYAILGELGCAAVADAPSDDGAVLASDPAEYRCDKDVTLFVTEGSAYVDIRDSADCWIRATLRAGETGLKVGGDVFRRVQPVLKGLPTKVVQVVSGGGKKKDVQIEKRFARDTDSIEALEYHKTRELVCDLCQQFFQAGWVTGTGGSISIRHGNRIYMTPSGVQKERISPDELFVLDINGEVIAS